MFTSIKSARDYRKARKTLFFCLEMGILALFLALIIALTLPSGTVLNGLQ